MKEISRRPMPTETAGITDIETFIHEGVKFAKLMTAADNGEQGVIESLLRGAGIPYVAKENTSDSWMRVFMGFCTSGVDFYVPEEMLDDATTLVMGEDAVELTDEELAALEEEAALESEDEEDA
ncbi:MAG: hypothetical protein J6S14_09730 [Clostridia bacterium]|jgi:hypothetical protein|nr:hypothetical protein [Clostridia bacterium]